MISFWSTSTKAKHIMMNRNKAFLNLHAILRPSRKYSYSGLNTTKLSMQNVTQRPTPLISKIQSWTTTNDNKTIKVSCYRSGSTVRTTSSISSTSTSTATSPSYRLGIGSQKWNMIGQATYIEIVHESLRNGITTIEAGQDGGDEVLASAVRTYFESEPSNSEWKPPIQILLRVGYRILHNTSTSTTTPGSMGGGKQLFPQDVQLPQQQQQQSSIRNSETTDTGNDSSTNDATTVVLHNVHPEYIEYVVQNSACVQLSIEYPNRIQIVLLVHNPEEQATTSIYRTSTEESSYEIRQANIRQRIQQSFMKLQELVNLQMIHSFGICSNGICLPKEHPLHLSWSDTVLPAIVSAASSSSSTTTTTHRTKPNGLIDSSNSTLSSKPTTDFGIVQMPCNCMETTAFHVANEIRTSTKQLPSFFTNDIQLYAMRPLSCYPNRGAGSGYPFVLIDYKIPATMDKVLTWTNEMTSYPLLYDVAYKTALQHLDASQIYDAHTEALASGKHIELSVEERETLDGCKLLQSLLHDLDTALGTVRSIQQYEDDLINKIVPLIRDTFDGYDNETATVLQSYFGAYGVAVKYAVATNTRQLVLHQGEVDVPIEYEATSATTDNMDDSSSRIQTMIRTLLPSEKRLQQFAIEFVLLFRLLDNAITNKKKTTTTTNEESREGQQEQLVPSSSNENQQPLIDKVMVGCTEPWQILDLVNIVKTL